MRLFFFATLLFALTSCNEIKNGNSASFDFSNLVGDWKTRDQSPATWERWTFDNENLNGVSLEVVGSDLKILETSRIEHMSETPVYSPRVVNQNGGKEVHVVCVNQNPSRIEFVNEQHDFPQVIFYEFINDDSLQATKSAFPLNVLSEKMTFAYSRLKEE